MKQCSLILFLLFSLHSFSQNLAQLVEQNEKSVFLITTKDKYGNPLSQGSGFFISEDGTGITNVHVLENAAKAEIKTTDNKTYSIDKILDYDSNFDLVKFKIANPANKKFRAVLIATLPPKKGEDIFVISNPMGLENTVSNGIVSSVRELEGYGHVIQVTAPVSPGSSGSPVFNMQGQVLGVITFLVGQGQNLNFAIDGQRIKELKENKQLALSDGTSNFNYEDFMIQALKAYDEENYQKALTYLNKEIERNPSNDEAYFYRGYSKGELEDYRGAISDYTQAISINPNLAKAFNNRGLSKDYLKDYQGAISDFTQAISININFELAYYNRGIAKRKLEDYQGAISDYTQAISINNNYAKAYNNRGVAKGELRDYRGGISDYTQAISINPKFADAYYNRGIAKYELKDYQGAISDFTQAISNKPNSVEAYYNRGVAKRILEDYRGAINDFIKAISINPNYAKAYYNRGIVKLILEDRDGGCADLRKAAELGAKEAYELIRKYCK